MIGIGNEQRTDLPMEPLKTLLDSAKATTYELLALLLPGGVVLLSVTSAFALAVPGDVLGYVAGAYVVGLALQGVGDFLFRRRPLSKVVSDPPSWQPMQRYALGLIKKKLDDHVPEQAALDICLTHVEARRNVYDKFIALRDTVRGLAIATVPATVLFLYARWSTLTAGGAAIAVFRVAGVVVVGGLLLLAFVERYGRFHPLAPQVVYGQFIATQLAEPPKSDPHLAKLLVSIAKEPSVPSSNVREP